MYTGPHIIKDGLVFGYDTGYGIADNNTATRFYKGQPSTNLFTVLGTPSSTDQNVTFAVNGTGTFKRVAVGTQLGDYKVTSDDVVYSYALGTNGCHYHGNDYSSVSSGSKVSLNIEYFLSNDVGSFNSNYLGNFEQLSGVGGSWGAVSSVKGVWHKVELTRTATATGNLRMLMYPGACGSSNLSDTGTIYYKNPTVTITDHPTPFVNGTRSSTASLIDLKGTASIDVSNVSFDSTGQPIWDGTNDRSDVTSHSAIEIVDNVSIEYVYKRLSTDPVLDVIANKYHSTGWELFCTTAFKFSLAGRNGDGTYYSTGGGGQTMVNNKFYHLVAQKEGTSWRLYVNGELDSSTTANSVGTWSNTGVLQIGGEGNGYFPNMELPVFKIYNKVLSTSEIKQNFKAYKNRFSI